eukprot:364834-Chlamydomonas_euryale.AAC.4
MIVGGNNGPPSLYAWPHSCSHAGGRWLLPLDADAAWSVAHATTTAAARSASISMSEAPIAPPVFACAWPCAEPPANARPSRARRCGPPAASHASPGRGRFAPQPASGWRSGEGVTRRGEVHAAAFGRSPRKIVWAGLCASSRHSRRARPSKP